MSTYPTAYTRAPTMLFALNSSNALGRTSYDLSRLNEQLASGRNILRPSDDPIRSATISTLDGRIENTEQLLQNLEFAGNSLNILDSSLGEAKSLIDEALGIALGQISSPADEESRKGQSVIVDSLLSSLFNISNTESIVGHVFGGTAPGHAPVSAFGGGYRFTGERGGLLAALGSASDIPITLGADNAIGALSNRIEGDTDLDPTLSEDTRLSDLNGARQLGVSKGIIEFQFNSGAVGRVDVSDAHTIGDVANAIEAAVIAYETEHGVSVLGPGGISVNGGSLDFDIVGGGDLEFNDLQGANVGADLGIVMDPATTFNSVSGLGMDLDPKLTWASSVSGLNGLGGASLDAITLNSNGQSHTVDLSGANTLGEIRSAIEAASEGIRVEIDPDGRGINIITETAGTRDLALSISEVSGGSDSATLLGIRSFAETTPISVFNDGRGVDIATGNSDPKQNNDFKIELGDGYEILIDLQPGDINTVGSLIDAINAQANAQLTADGRPTSDFEAQLSPTTNGIEFTQAASVGVSGGISILADNSPAAEQLGLLDAKVTNGGDTLVSEDRAKVRVNNLFTHLLDLSEALKDNDTLGIEIASQSLEVSLDELIQSRALVGGYAKRIDTEVLRQEDKKVLDEAMRSQVRDLDYAQASSRFSQLQLQLQATMSVISQTQSRTLLDFLG